jgi:hypothetical protein
VLRNEPSEHALERRYRLLLRVYPAGYLADRGDEILGTLLDTAPPGRTVPSLRDACALVLAGLRVRAKQDPRLSAPGTPRLAVVLFLAIPVVTWAASRVGLALRIALGDPGFPPPLVRALGGPGVLLAVGSVTLIAVALIWFAPRPLMVPILLAPAALILIVMLRSLMWPGSVVYLGILLALTVLTTIRPQRPPRSWLWLTAAVPVAEIIAMTWRGMHPGTAEAAALVVACSALLLWMCTDAHPALEIWLLLAAFGVLAAGTALGDNTLPVGAAAGLVAVATVRLQFAPGPARGRMQRTGVTK